MVDDRRQGGEEMHHTPEPESKKSAFAKREEDVLAFWNKEKIFEKSLTKPAPKGEYVFYDGPPFANGLPHYGHILASAIKDTIPRYRTMRGYRVLRRWGWDCHGLPVENLVEKELGFKTKRDIEQYGIAQFNAAARRSIMKDVADWKRIIPRMGRWADMDGDYKTMDATYTESVWWAFKNLYKRGLIYEGFKAMHLCPRCGTTLSNFEVAQGYQDIDDYAVTVKLPLVDEPETSLLIWTTTTWTLPGNTAAALKADATYVKARTDDGFVIVAKDLAQKVLGAEAKIYGEISGKDLVGKKYDPPFDYFKDSLHKHKTHAFKVYAAPYVTLEDGTGIVHLAPAYGAEDLELAQKEKIPLIHHVTDEGKFIATVADFAHLPVKPKGRHQETDLKIIDNLKSRGRLFREEKITHSYPHCWRCDTPLLNWAANSWFVAVSKLKNKLLKQNASVGWVPPHVGDGRFQNGLRSAPDWAISRSRYWGAPIPVWRHSKTKEIKVVGSVEELLSMVRRSGNHYFVMRHGEARSNVEGFLNSDNSIENHITEQGKKSTHESIKALKQKSGIDLIVVSPLVRTQETALIAQRIFNLPDSAVMTDERLSERQMGEFNGGAIEEWRKEFHSFGDHFTKSPGGSENFVDLRKRMGAFLFDIERRYTNKNILIVTHGDPAWCLSRAAERVPLARLVHMRKQDHYLEKAEWEDVPFIPFPHNDDYELDLHRPYIDDISLGDSLSGEWKRVESVFDCWFESGAMPFASNHYPFAKKTFNPKRLFGFFSKGYPADFIAEGLDQTRGWFYSLIVLGVALFGRAPYKNVIVNGLVLAEDGQKMSKRLKNYPDPMDVVDSCGADALRYYLLSSPVIRGEDLNFSLRGVEEVSKKLLMRLDNVRSFYDLYAPKHSKPNYSEENSLAQAREASEDPRGLFRKDSSAAGHVLDRWILSRLGELVRDTTLGFEAYELDAATRPLAEFIDDLSTWYLRRSRDRIKLESDDKTQALLTLRFVLKTLAQTMAPVMPFFAEDLYRRMRGDEDSESVHLSPWPMAPAVDEQMLLHMRQVRAIASKALELREKAGIKIRQPLGMVEIRYELPEELQSVLAAEINVKTVTITRTTVIPGLADDVVLDTNITPELQEAGWLRDTARAIQTFRKDQGLSIHDHPVLVVAARGDDTRLFEKFRQEIIAQTGIADLQVSESKEGDPEVAPMRFM